LESISPSKILMRSNLDTSQAPARTLRILYGVMGEGLGHAMRARVITECLRDKGHTIKIFTSGRAVEVLRRYHDDVVEIDGLFLRYKSGKVRRAASFFENLLHTPARLKINSALPLKSALEFNPDIIFTDFDSFAHTLGIVLKRPIISLDHQHAISMFQHPKEIIGQRRMNLFLTKTFIEAKTPRCTHYLVTSFYFPEPKKRHRSRATLVGPIIRPEIKKVSPVEGDHILVYQTAAGNQSLLSVLEKCAEIPFIVYGSNLTSKSQNVIVKPFSEEGFIHDLASARAVITNGGFTTLGEALYLGKPVLSLPLLHQGEQELNAAYVEWLGVGAQAPMATPELIYKFVNSLHEYRCCFDPRLMCGTEDAITALEDIFKMLPV